MSSWQEEFRDSFRNTHDLAIFLETELPTLSFQSFIPRTFAKRIKELGPNSSLWKQFVPNELEARSEGLYDPIGDTAHAKEGQIIHRYKNRALFLPTTVCPISCRYCFRKNELNEKDELFARDFEKTKKYIQDHPEIEEIIFSGGDPLILNDSKLDFYMAEFSALKIKHIRFHSRTPVILPSRIDDGFEKLIQKYDSKFETITLVIHLNHTEEVDNRFNLACQRLKKLPLQLLSQSVLLKGINDDSTKLKELFKTLHRLGIRPYYLHHPDMVKGGMHFWLSLEEGREIYGKLRDFLPGWMLPNYIIDVPGGHGKTPAFNPENLTFSGFLLNRFGNKISISKDFLVDN